MFRLLFCILLFCALSLSAAEKLKERYYVWQPVANKNILFESNSDSTKQLVFPIKSKQSIRIGTSDRNIDTAFSSGSGLFQKISMPRKQGFLQYTNETNGLGWIKLSIDKNTEINIFQSADRYYNNHDFMLYQPASSLSLKSTQDFKLSDSQNIIQRKEMNEGEVVKLYIDRPGLLLFKHQLNYEKISGEFDVLYQINWQAPNAADSVSYSTRPELRRIYDSGCLYQFGQEKETLLVVEKAGWYQFSSNKSIWASFYLMNDKEELFGSNEDSLNRITQTVVDNSEANRIANAFNVYMDNNFFHEAMQEVVEKSSDDSLFNLLKGKHSYYKSLHPHSLTNQLMLYGYYSIYSDPAQLQENAPVYINQNLTDAIASKLSSGYFYQINSRGLAYELPKELFENSLRLAITNLKAPSTTLKIQFDTGDIIQLNADGNFLELTKAVNFVDIAMSLFNQKSEGELATLSKDFAAKKHAAPFLNTVTGNLNIPDGAKSFKIISDEPVWISVAYPQRSFYRSFEFNEFHKSLSEQTFQENFIDFLELYNLYVKIKVEYKSYNNLKAYLESLNTAQLSKLQAWSPYYREIYTNEVQIPAKKQAHIKLWSLKKIQQFSNDLIANHQGRLLRETLTAHLYYSDEQAVRHYAFNELYTYYLKNERYRQILKLAQINLIRHGDEEMLDIIARMYQAVNHHKKAIFFFSLKPTVIDNENLMASLFNLRQWDLFQKFNQKSQWREQWQNLYHFLYSKETVHLTNADRELIAKHGYSWLTDDRFTLNFVQSANLVSTSTLTNKQVKLISDKKHADLYVKGPLDLKLRLSKKYPNSRYTKSNYILKVTSKGLNKEYLFSSIPAQSWLSGSDGLIGTFGDVQLHVPKGNHHLKLNLKEGEGYFYVENKRNLLALNINQEQTLDHVYALNNAKVYQADDAEDTRLVGYIKQNCNDLIALEQTPLKVFRPTNLDFDHRNEWLKTSTSNDLTAFFLQAMEYDSKQCGSTLKATEDCIKRLMPSVEQRELHSALKVLSFIDRYPTSHLTRYRRDVFDYFKWVPYHQVLQTDGRISIRSEQLQSDSAFLETIKNLNQDDLSNLYLRGNRVQGINLASQNSNLNVEFVRANQNAIKLAPIKIWYQFDELPPESILLPSLREKVLLEQKASYQTIKFWLSEESHEQLVSINITDYQLPPTGKDYYVATVDIPVVVQFNDNQRLKVVSQSSTHGRQVFEKNINLGNLEVLLESNEDETYYRLFHLQPSYGKRNIQKVAVDPYLEEQAKVVSIENRDYIKADSIYNRQFRDLSLIATNDATYDFGISYANSLDPEQEESQEPQNYVALDGRYRYFDEVFQLYYSGDGQLRQGDDYSALKAEFRMDWLPKNSPWEYNAYINSWSYDGDENSFQTYQVGGSAAYQFLYNERHSLTSRVSVFFRDISDSSFLNDAFTKVPTDIWGQYKQDHRFGLSMQQRWNYEFLKDLHFYADIKAVNNQNITSSDYYQGRLGSRFLYDTLSLDAYWANRRYLSDRHRQFAYNSNRFRLDLDWLFWQDSKNLFELGFSYLNNSAINSNTFNLNFRWILHNGNILSDYRPSTYRFKRLRSHYLTNDVFEKIDRGMAND